MESGVLSLYDFAEDFLVDNNIDDYVAEGFFAQADIAMRYERDDQVLYAMRQNDGTFFLCGSAMLVPHFIRSITRAGITVRRVFAESYMCIPFISDGGFLAISSENYRCMVKGPNDGELIDTRFVVPADSLQLSNIREYMPPGSTLSEYIQDTYMITEGSGAVCVGHGAVGLNDAYYIKDVATVPDSRNQGHAQKVVAYIADKATTEDKKCYTVVSDGNAAMQAALLKAGFFTIRMYTMLELRKADVK